MNDDGTEGRHLKIENIMRFCKAHVVLVICFLLVLSWIFCSTLTFFFERNLEESNIHSFWDALWWGIITLTTVGYGDFYPVSASGRFVGVALVMSGVISVAVVTAKISSILLEQLLIEGRGTVDRKLLNQHIILCGWRPDFEAMLLSIRDYNKDLGGDQIVIVANLSESMIADLRANPKLTEIKFINGDYFHAATLQRAVPERARKIIIVTDQAPDNSGRIPNASEADARTVMTAITLSSIAKNTLVTAEISDPKMDSYLKMAGVTEIIYSGQFGRQLLVLGSAKCGAGVANIVHDLLDPSEGGLILTVPIPDHFRNITYSDFCLAFENNNKGSLVIGVLENTGNHHSMKEFALRDAQKTADVPTLINNLRSVKTLRCNKPIFNPDKNYLIPPASAAIVISNVNANDIHTDFERPKITKIA